MNTGDINKRIYELLSELHMLTHLPELNEEEPEEINLTPIDGTLGGFMANPNSFVLRHTGPEEVHLPYHI